jgi:UDP-glucose 4-epimerase
LAFRDTERSIDGPDVRDFVPVVDVVEAYVQALPVIQPGVVSTFNVGSGAGTRIVDLGHVSRYPA